jgi:hypothetical protein
MQPFWNRELKRREIQEGGGVNKCGHFVIESKDDEKKKKAEWANAAILELRAKTTRSTRRGCEQMRSFWNREQRRREVQGGVVSKCGHFGIESKDDEKYKEGLWANAVILK